MRLIRLLSALFIVPSLVSVSSAQILNRVDFFANTGTWAQAANPNGTEANSLAADPGAFGSTGLNVWDSRGRPGHSTYSASTFSNLLNTATGAASGVSMSFSTISAAGDNAGGANDLTRDYLILLQGQVDSSTFTISGLQPNTQTKLYVHPGILGGRQFNIAVNTASNVFVPVNGLEVITTSNPLGQVTGTWSRIGAEANWAGLQIYQPAAALGINPVVNGSFELPTPVPAGSNNDTVIPTAWNYTGTSPYPRVGSGGYGYPAAADGTTILAVEGERNGVLFQDLGTMKAGETYTLRGVVSSSNGDNAFRASFIGDPLGAPLELAFITDANFDPTAGGFLNFMMSYLATATDNGKVLRLQLSDNGSTTGTRSAFDNLSVTVTAAAVPEPVSIAIWSLLGVCACVAAIRVRRSYVV